MTSSNGRSQGKLLFLDEKESTSQPRVVLMRHQKPWRIADAAQRSWAFRVTRRGALRSN